MAVLLFNGHQLNCPLLLKTTVIQGQDPF